jgi:hypothetical protein
MPPSAVLVAMTEMTIIAAASTCAIAKAHLASFFVGFQIPAAELPGPSRDAGLLEDQTPVGSLRRLLSSHRLRALSSSLS